MHFLVAFRMPQLHQEVGRASNEQLVRSSEPSGSGGGGGISEN